MWILRHSLLYVVTYCLILLQGLMSKGWQIGAETAHPNTIGNLEGRADTCAK